MDIPPSLLATEEQSDGGASRNEVQSQNNKPRMDVKEGTKGRQQDQRPQEQEQQPTEDEPDGKRLSKQRGPTAICFTEDNTVDWPL